MWTLIHEKDYDNFLKTYPQLQDYAEELKLYVANGYIFLPRLFHKNFPFPKLIFHTDKTFKAAPLNIKFTKELWPEQEPIIYPFVDLITRNANCSGILKARPGSGKTVMAIYLACLSNKKTLIVIDNTKLAEQWIESIIEFTNAKYEDIGWIKGDSVNLDAPFIIAMEQTLTSRVKTSIETFYQTLSDSGIGLAFMDECHRSALGPVYAKSSLLINCRDLIGLSATPFPYGYHDIIMSNTFGQILSDSKNYDLVPEITFVKYNSQPTVKQINSVLYISDNFKRKAKYNKLVTESPRYYDVICKLSRDLVRDNHREIIIVKTKEQVNNISQILTKDGITNVKFFSQQRNVDKKNDKVLVATYDYAGAGFDYKELSSCIIATPLAGRKSLIQVVGRVVRSAENKQQPKVYILIDIAYGSLFLKDMEIATKILEDEFGTRCLEIEM